MRKTVCLAAMFGIATVLTAFMTPNGFLLAHHGTSTSYHQDQTVQIVGKVTKVAWKNPHSQLYIDVTEGPFKGQNYAVELNSPGVMVRQGWTKSSLRRATTSPSASIPREPARPSANVSAARSSSTAKRSNPGSPVISEV